MSEDTPVAPRSRKGALRAEALETWMAAHRRGDVAVTIGRAADFFGPGAERAYLGDHFFQRVLAGQTVQALGDPDQPHAYAYTPDVAAGLIALGRHDEALGKTWMLPAQPALSTRELMTRLGRAAGRDLRIQRVPSWMLRVVGLFSGEMREIAEMTYQWQQPYAVDDTRIRGLGVVSTPIDTAVTATAAWALAHYGREKAGSRRGPGKAAGPASVQHA